MADLAHEVGSNRCLSLAGKTTLRQLLVLFTLADVLVTNDSGPAHIAAAFGVPTAVIFGPSDSEVWAPWLTESAVFKADNIALTAPDVVIEQLERLMAAAGAGK